MYQVAMELHKEVKRELLLYINKIQGYAVIADYHGNILHVEKFL